MRVLILTCNTGQGHNSAAAALEKILKQNGVHYEIKDALAFISKGSSALISKGHTFLYRHLPSVFKKGYRSAEKHRGVFKEKSLLYRFFSLGSKKLYKYCLQGGYDTVISSHAFAGIMLTNAVRKYGLKVKSYFFTTDYTCSPSVEQADLDVFFIPHSSLADEFVRCGVPKERLVPSGIPVRHEFYEITEKSKAKELLKISPEKKHLLMMCGSMGCGPMKKLSKELAKSLPSDAVMTVVCGTNKRLYKKLKKAFASNAQVRVEGFVENIPLLMDSADLYFTKPGGISVTEAAVKMLPMVLFNTVEGCETPNLKFYTENGSAVTAENDGEIVELCISLLKDDAALEKMTENMKKLRPCNASEFIYNYIIGENNNG